MSESGKPSFENSDESSSPEGDEYEPVESSHNSASFAVARKSHPSTRVSLLIEALVRNVVLAYEPDGQRAPKAYRKICKRLFQMGLIDESWNMAELEGARVQFENALLQLIDGVPGGARTSSLLLQGAYCSSQYKREFHQFEKIGRGAFGKVFRVQHKLDGTEYAVKEIPIYSEGLDSVKNYLAEVKTFASLNHTNIVQYKAAWLELWSPRDLKAITNKPKLIISDQTKTEKLLFQADVSTSSLMNERNSSFEDECEHKSYGSPTKTNGRVSSISKHISYQSKLAFSTNSKSSAKNRKTNSSSNFEIVFEHGSKGILTNDDSNNSTPTNKAIVPTQQNGAVSPKIRWATLYIQMALCHGTLDQWMRRRNESFNAEIAIMSSGAHTLRTNAIRQILIQILRGLKYIHSKGVVHHDIKPSNIFVSAEAGSLLAQLGDFGLACPLQRSRHGFARGTPLYAAPEQLTGRCDPKSDMYSVGIVLFELLEDFGTDMERTKRISKLRGKTDPPVPSDLTLGNLVSSLVRRSALERPDASTLLQALEGAQGGVRPDVKALHELVDEKEREIQRLKKLLRAHGVEDV